MTNKKNMQKQTRPRVDLEINASYNANETIKFIGRWIEAFEKEGLDVDITIKVNPHYKGISLED